LKRRKSCLIALGIVLVSKFSNGAGITALVIPAFVLVFRRMKRYNERLARVTRSEAPLDLSNLTEPVVVVPLRRLDQVAQKALRFAITISRDVYVVQVMAEELDTEDLRERWRERWRGRCAGAATSRRHSSSSSAPRIASFSSGSCNGCISSTRRSRIVR
jgi:hypothetical protein